MTNIQKIYEANQDYFDSVVGNDNPTYKKVIIKTDSVKTVVEYNPTIANYLNSLGFPTFTKVIIKTETPFEYTTIPIDMDSVSELETLWPKDENNIPVEMTFYPNEKNEIRFVINIDAEDLEEILEYEI